MKARNRVGRRNEGNGRKERVIEGGVKEGTRGRMNDKPEEEKRKKKRSGENPKERNWGLKKDGRRKAETAILQHAAREVSVMPSLWGSVELLAEPAVIS